MADERDVARAYDRWSASYDSDVNATRDLDATVLRRAPLRLHGRHVLELGCGTGKNTAWLATKAARVTALDFSDGMLAVARERVTAYNVEFVRHDLRSAWPLRDESADVVVGNLVLEHLENLPPIFAEAARVLTGGGQLFLSELHPFRQLRGGQAHFADPSSGETVAVTAHRHSTSEYVNSTIAAGFTLIELGEWLEEDASADTPPRLLSLLGESRGA
ncbi:MAG: methyltransferase domain-containing protein [Gemmatimonadota bacterium]|nr:methyltransferase domain-containing protein [Gemmatimonadota bacterium]